MPTYEKGGGCRRMMQIYEALTSAFPGLRRVDQSGGNPVQERLKEKIRIASRRTDLFAPHRLSPRIRKWDNAHLATVYRLREMSKIWLRTIEDWPELDLAFMDDPVYFLPLLKKLVRRRIPVVAICHNLETLAPLQVKKGRTLDLFREELRALSLCRLAVTISREETVLLNNLGVPAAYFPYYPGRPILDRLRAVRAARGSSPKEGFLAVGNAKNHQTREGLENLGRYWRERNMGSRFGKLMLGGFKAKKFLSPNAVGPGVEFFGTPDGAELDRIASGARAFLCYQESGSGALTRICEMLVAGIPVLANSHAARSYYNTKGLIEFEGLDSLEDALMRLDAFYEDIPEPPAPDPSRWIARLKKNLEAGK